MEFTVQDITKFDADSDLVGAKVEFNLPDAVGELDVLQGVSVSLRVSIHADTTLGQIEEILLNKALDQLRAVLAKCEGKTARELRVQSEDFASSLLPDMG
ncbi:hypothetical protein GCM10011491_31140 [Brucella endophytica]|uniref:Uncharacterized protein n=1 Tax=Brucella endophytica TaxID=1963359 RepID=A0A916WH53_9HYPH|nr:hypothetical protein [Brucella endophytica]GGB00726.1 hypothetical protein GCM10011491_31140 [Brucella endophytica]